MDDNSTPEVVTEDEAIEKVKAWIAQMDWEKAKEGSLEILEIDPNNEEVKVLLTQAEKGIAERPTEAVKPVETVVKAAAEVPTPTNTPATPPSQPQPKAQTPVPQPAVAQAPTATPASMPARKSKTTVIIAGIVFFLVVVLLILALVFGWPIRLIG